MGLVSILIMVGAFQFPSGSDRVELRPQATGSLCGRVVDKLSVTGRRTGAFLRLDGPGHSDQVSTAIGSMFCFYHVPPGDYTLEVIAPGYRRWNLPLRNWSGLGLDSNLIVVLEPDTPPSSPPAGSMGVDVRALQTPRKAREEQERALRLAAKGNWKKSLELFEKAVAAYPDYFDAWNNMGVVLSRLNRDAEAEAAYLKAIKIDPKASAPRRNLGYFHLVRGQMTRAQEELEAAADLNPRDARAQVYLGNLLYRMGKPGEAEAHLKRAYALQPEMPLLLHQLGFVTLSLNRPQEALHWFEQFLKRSPSSPASEEVRALVARLKKPS